ncbi:MAG: zinc ABC transporter substrate-binding protein [Nitrospirae bacterium]|nr:MAG: zinc ABC transporter substrate-binding protein [Nitrospirota bacterium]
MRKPFAITNRAWMLAACLLLGASVPSWAEEPLPVVVTIPVLKDWAEQVGGAHVRVLSLISGLESEHSYSPKPSDLIALRKARLLLQVGIGLEVWVASLVKNSGNAGLLVVTTSEGIELIQGGEAHAGTRQAHDDRHPSGNPHVWLDPDNAKVMIRHLADAFSLVDPAHAAEYRRNEAAYVRQIEQLQAELTERFRQVPERRIIVHHPAWPYFARRFGLTIAGEIVTQAGAEPSAHHIQELIAEIRKDRIRVVVSEPQLNQKIPEVLARETGVRVVVLTPLSGGLPGTATYLEMLGYNGRQLAHALAQP